MSYSFALIVTFGCILCNCILTYCYRDDPTVCEPVKDEPGCVCKTSDGKYISLLSLANPDLSPSRYNVSTNIKVYFSNIV